MTDTLIEGPDEYPEWTKRPLAQSPEHRDALNALWKAGARLIRCGNWAKPKRGVEYDSGWRRDGQIWSPKAAAGSQFDSDQAASDFIRWMESATESRPRTLGWEPGSIGAVVIDIDSDDTGFAQVLAERTGARILESRREGAYHVVAKHSGDPLGRTWSVDGAFGEVIGSRAYACIWDGSIAQWVADGMPGEITSEIWQELTGRQERSDGWQTPKRPDALEDDMRRLESALFSIPTPSDTGDWVKLATAALRGGLDPDTVDRWCSRGIKYEPGEIEQLVRLAQNSNPRPSGIGSIFEQARAMGWRWQAPRRITKGPQNGAKNGPDGGAGGDGNDKRTIDAEDIAAALAEFGIGIRFNSRRGSMELSNSDKWEQINDRSEAHLWDRLRSQMGMRIGIGNFRLYLKALASNNVVDPFIVWLESLPEWDGEARLHVMLNMLFDSPAGDPLSLWVSAFPFLGAVARAYEPGAKLDIMPVLIGPQGVGKSAFLANMFPARYQSEWFSDAVDLNAPDARRLIEPTLGKVVVEFSEMVGSRRADVERLKAFVTRQNDGDVRLAYAHNPEERLRRWVGIGTTNDDDPLPNDPTGNRRFVIAKTPNGSHIEAVMEKYRDQLWAEATHRYANSLPIQATDSLEIPHDATFPRHLIELQTTTNRAHRSRNETLEGHIEAINSQDAVGGIRLNELFRLAPDLADYRKQPRILAAALLQCGWTKGSQRRDGKRVRLWFPPEDKSSGARGAAWSGKF